MSGTLFKEVNYSLTKLIEDIDLGEIGLPEIQRPFVWENAKVRDLFDSMYRGFPVGYLLFWSTGEHAGKRQIGTSAKQKAPRLLIVDGQQRLTSLYAVISGIEVVRKDFSKGRIPIAFRPSDARFEVADAAIRKNPEFIADISELWSKELPRNRFVKRYIERLRTAREVNEDEEDQLTESIDRLYDLRAYPFTALELSSELDEEQVADVFVRINSKGTPLVQADFILTLMSVHWDEGRTALEEFCRTARVPNPHGPSPYNHFLIPDPDELLRVDVGLGFRRARLQHVYSILRGKDLVTKQVSSELREQQFERLQKAQSAVLNLQEWQDFLHVLRAAGYRSSSMITSKNAVLYAYVLHLIGRRDFGIDRETLRQSIAEWFFMAHLTRRYTNSPETVMEEDLGSLVRDAGDADDFVLRMRTAIDEALTNDFWTINLPSQLATSSANSPTLNSYHAALCLLGAPALFSTLSLSDLLDPTTKGAKASVERHHLFPKGYLRKLGITKTRETNQIANFAFVEWWKNIEISDDGPAEYFPRYREVYEQRAQIGDLTEMMELHALPLDWHNLAYEDFLERRRSLIAKVTRKGYLRLRATAGEEASIVAA